MSEYVQYQTSGTPLTFLMVDNADHITGKTGLSPSVTIRKNGGVFAAPAGAVSEIGNGWYEVAGNASDSNTYGPLLLHAEAAGADPTESKFCVVAFNPYDAASLGLSTLDAPITSRQATLDASARNAIADALLTRDWTAVTGEAARSLLNALRFLRNKWSIAGTTMTVTKEDDVTTAWTSTLTTSGSAEPVTSSDPA